MPDKREKEPSQPNHENIDPDSPLNRLFHAWGLFDSHTPQGKDPTTYPIQVMDLRNHQIEMQVFKTPHADPALTQAWPTWSKRDPFEHGPASCRSAITEAIRDAQANPGKDTENFPHLAPIELNDEEFAILLKITKARNLPSTEKRIFSYTEHAPLLDARSETFRRSPAYPAIQERMIREGILKPRAQIAEEIRQRQAPWTVGSPKTPQSPRTPQK